MLTLNKELYCFRILLNETKKTVLLLPAGVAIYNDGKLRHKNKDEYAFNQYGQVYLCNYYDLVKKFGKKPCVVVDEYYNPIFDHFFTDQKEIEDYLGIKTSELNSRAHKNNDIIAAKHSYKNATNHLSEIEVEKYKNLLEEARNNAIRLSMTA